MGSSDERPVTVHRVRAREPWLLGFVASLVVPALLVWGFFAINTPLAALLLIGGWQYVLGLVILLAWSCWRRANRLEVEPAPTTARASEKGLFVDGGPLLDRGGITAAYVSPSWPEGAYVRVLRRGGFAAELWTADVEGAHALVASLGLDEQHVVGVVRGTARIAGRGSRVGAFLVALSAGIALTALWSKLALALPLLFVAWTILSFVPAVHVVGTDGVLTRWLGRRVSFVPIGDIASVEPEPGRVVLHLREGSEHELWIARRVGSDAATIGLSVSLLADRIRGAMRRAGTLEVDATALGRNGRELSAWLSSLRELGAQGTGYRAAVQREDLVFLVEDARRPPEIRIAAAVALGKADAHERARIRIAAESSSMPEVREALEAALEADDERVSSTLGRLDDAS